MSRKDLEAWEQLSRRNFYTVDEGFKSLIARVRPSLDAELEAFGEKLAKADALLFELSRPENLPRLEPYDRVGNRVDRIVHHPHYETVGNIIYGSRIMERFLKPGGLTEALAFLFLSAQLGEAGHNCPIACSAGILRVFEKIGDFPEKEQWRQKLIAPSYSENYTGAQFVTEIQGGSDVGQNATRATPQADGSWRIAGEKWFCSNADAELILMTARYDETIPGTKGLGLFLVRGGSEGIYIRRLKEKFGTRSLATAEIDFVDVPALAMGPPEEGFKLLMENVVHLSRLCNSVCVLGMARRAYHLARAYAETRSAFGHRIIEYPLVQENLDRIKAENDGYLAATFSLLEMHDRDPLLLRLLTNLAKTRTAKLSVEHIHHCLDVLAGNGTIESFSSIPRLLSDCIICENWEGTHNTLYMQILKDILRYDADVLFLKELRNGSGTLKEDLANLRKATPKEQNLLIRPLVEKMGDEWARQERI